MKVRSVLAALAATALAVAFQPASPASASIVPTSPYCFTVDGEGVCVELEASATVPLVPTSDTTVTVVVNVGFYCPGTPHTIESVCAAMGSVAPLTIGRTGVVMNPLSVGSIHVTDLRVPEVCTPLGCNGPYFVPVDVPIVRGGPTVYIAGSPVTCSCD